MAPESDTRGLTEAPLHRESQEETDRKLRAPARGEPAKLEQADVEKLARGELTRSIVARLASQPVMGPVERPEGAAAARFTPVHVAAADRELALSGETSERLREALETSAKMPGRFGDISPPASAKAAPKLSPYESSDA